MVLIGQTTPADEHIITLLRSGKLLEQVMTATGGTLDLGASALLRAIHNLNASVESRLISVLSKTNTKACSVDEIRRLGVIPYCEDKRQSLAL